jgi:hypothetical protein
MAKKTPETISPVDLVRLLAEVADVDTVYRDVYLRRARALLADQLTVDQHRGMRTVQGQLDELVAGSRAAAMLQDWKFVQDLTQRAEQLRRGAEQTAKLGAVGELVYDAPTVAIDPFSPGMAALAKAGPELADLRDKTVATLAHLAAGDASHAAFYEARRAFLAGLALARRKPDAAATKQSATPRAVADLERLAFEAAQRGDVAELGNLSKEILAAQEAAAKKPAAKGAPAEAAPTAALDPCPVDLAAPFPADVATRASALGFAVARTEPLPQAAPLFDYVAARLGQPVLQDAGGEHDGALKIEALVEQGAWPPNVAEPVKVLVSQFVRSAFVSSGGARYRPVFAAESVLIEDFPEDQEPPADAKLLTALSLKGRRGLAREEIEHALLERGAAVLETELGLDPLEYRLVCVPQDLYSRFGRDHGWGAARQWTHFDGYQVIKGGRLRALVGGDVRYGGLNDLASIAPSDQRDSVVARFAVIRRARQVARWR